MPLTKWLSELTTDVRFALRQLRAAPGFAAVAVLTLALGLGANTAIFALVDGALLRPLPFEGADRLVIVEETSALHGGALRSRIAPLSVVDWNRENITFELLAAAYLSPGGGGPGITGTDGTPEIVTSQSVTARFFDVLGAKPIAGRAFIDADDGRDDEPVLLSEQVWQQRFGRDPSLIGRALLFDGRPRTVVGIMPRSFQYFRPSGMWTLLRSSNGRRPFAGLRVIGRMKPGVTVEAAEADLNRIADALAAQYDDTRPDRRVTVQPLRTAMVGRELRFTSLLFLGVVGFVLLMCCSNVASLTMARATARERELAVRLSLGASGRRIAKQLLTESLVLATLGGLAGAACAAAILSLAPSLVPTGLIPSTVTPVFDVRVVVFCAVAAVAVGILFGVAPAFQAARGSIVQHMTAGRTSTGSTRVRSLLVAAQTATAVVLLVGAGLLLRTLAVVDGFDSGYGAASDSVLTLDVTASRGANGPRYQTDDARRALFDAIQREVSATPGVRSAAWATTLFGESQTGSQSFLVGGEAPVPEADRPSANYQIVSPAYFSTVGVPIVLGRGFRDGDNANGQQVCIVSEAFVRRYLQGRDPIGSRIVVKRIAAPGDIEREVIGVAAQVKGRADEVEELAQLYVPHAQDAWGESYLLVRAASGPATAIVPLVRAAIARVDQDLPVRNVRTLADVSAESTARYRFRALMVSTFAGLGLSLALVGVFGVLAYSVQQRRREFGVRIALGATPAGVFRLVMGSAARLVAGGVVAGVIASTMLSRSLGSVLFGVEPLDSATFVGVGGVIVLTVLLAALPPAVRAIRIDPIRALRAD
jgi:putative ABC transport system permease protein